MGNLTGKMGHITFGCSDSVGAANVFMDLPPSTGTPVGMEVNTEDILQPAFVAELLSLMAKLSFPKPHLSLVIWVLC